MFTFISNIQTKITENLLIKIGRNSVEMMKISHFSHESLKINVELGRFVTIVSIWLSCFHIMGFTDCKLCTN